MRKGSSSASSSTECNEEACGCATACVLVVRSQGYCGHGAKQADEKPEPKESDETRGHAHVAKGGGSTFCG